MIQLKLQTKICISCLAMVWFVISCGQEVAKPPEDFEVAAAWADMTNYIAKNTPSNSPTFASRCLGYIGLTLYECVVNGYPEYQSVAPQLNGLGTLPLPEKNTAYSWLLALNAGQAEILRSLYIQTSDNNKSRIDSLESHFQKVLTIVNTNKKVADRSVIYGKKIALQVFEWSKTDGGHRGYLKNFDKKLVFDEKPGCWRPALYGQSFSHYPLHPHWGQNRTFLPQDSSITAPAFIPYDTVPGSAYYNEFMQVYEINKKLTQQQKEAAIWWGDDPDETFTPPGHSYYLATLAIRKVKPSLIKCAQTYASIGMAVADAFRNCWKWKYAFFTERANTFIPKYIDPRWASFWPDPPFPAFPSGHAIQAAAAAAVLTNLFGDHFQFTDSAHAGRKRDEIRNADFKPRHFKSFWEAAEEIANSRLYGGIHIPRDNAAGLEKGKLIGENLNRLAWKKIKI